MGSTACLVLTESLQHHSDEDSHGFETFVVSIKFVASICVQRYTSEYISQIYFSKLHVILAIL